MKSVNKSKGLTVKLSRDERRDLRKAARLETRRQRRPVSSGEILRDGGMDRVHQILQGVPSTIAPATAEAPAG